jgi:hypothetical protein
MFFLINNFPKTLLRMPFISKIKMAINYKDNSLWDNTFINLKDLKNAYIIIIVLLLKNVFRRRV